MPKITQEHADAQRRKIIDAAYQCFARSGFHQTTMRQICEEAKLSTGAIYTYFNSKEDIIQASFAFDYQRSLPLFDLADKDADPVAAIDNLIDTFFAGLQDAAMLGADRVNIQGWGEALVNPRLMAPLRDSLVELPKRLARLIRRAQKAGVVPTEVNTEATGQVIVSSYLGLYLQKAVNPDLDIRKYRAAVHALLHGAFAN